LVQTRKIRPDKKKVYPDGGEYLEMIFLLKEMKIEYTTRPAGLAR
jgi:hypothetical protein